jgi:hypothetical protein
MRVSLIEEGFRPAGGDFQGMRIYRSDMASLFLGGEELTPPVIDHRPR